MNRFLLLLFALFIGWTGCQQPASENPSATASFSPAPAVVYEVFVQAFADSDGDGIGDLPGLIAQLDYFVALDVDALWLMPIHPSPSYHKYDVVDYKGIHPDYGTMEDYERLVEEAHVRGIDIILDLVVNHTSDEHHWFQEAVSSPTNPYRNYYVWAKIDSIREEIEKKETSEDSDNLTQWHPVEGQDEHYYGFFWGGMPDLNFDNPKVREEIYEIGRFWLEEVGVDGFRLDAARHIYPSDQQAKNHQFWEEFRAEMQKSKPDVYLVGEVYESPEIVTPYLQGLPALFNFGLAKAIIHSLNHGHDSGLVQTHHDIRTAYQAVNPDFVDATILSNHDQRRIMTAVENDPQKARMAASLLFTLPGTPYIYYGEELGMRGDWPHEAIREPFLWGEDATHKTHWREHRDNPPGAVDPLPVQMEDSSSMYHHYRELIEVRKGNETLLKGELALTPVKLDGMVDFFRVHEGDTLLVIHNVSDSAFQLPYHRYLRANYPRFIWSDGISKGDSILPAYGSVVLGKEL